MDIMDIFLRFFVVLDSLSHTYGFFTFFSYFVVVVVKSEQYLLIGAYSFLGVFSYGTNDFLRLRIVTHTHTHTNKQISCFGLVAQFHS